jgi:hypothetical protein
VPRFNKIWLLTDSCGDLNIRQDGCNYSAFRDTELGQTIGIFIACSWVFPSVAFLGST